MTARCHKMSKAIITGALILTLFGCGGPFLQGNLINCPVPYYADIDSLEITLIRPDGAQLSRRFPFEVSKGGKKITFECNKKELEGAFGNIQLDETIGRFRIKYEKYMNRMLVVSRDSAGQQIVNTTRMRSGFQRLDCDRLYERFPELAGTKGIRVFEKYDKISTADHELPLPGASKAERKINLDVSVYLGMKDLLDCDMDDDVYTLPED